MDVRSALVVGIDLGTQSTKVLVYQPQTRQVLATVQSPHELSVGDDGRREQQATWWIHALHSCFAQLQPGLKQRVIALGVSGQQHGFVPIGADGAVLAPVKLWNDTSTVTECADLHKLLGGEQCVVAMAGNAILPGYTASKILWLKRHRPMAYAQLRHILLPHDYLNFYLTGRYTMECGDASGTGFLDIRTRSWCEPILRAIDPDQDLRALLPPLISPMQAVGEVLPAVAAELGLPAGVLVSAGGGDNMMGAIGTGAIVPGQLTISLGTSGTLYAYAEQPTVAQDGEFAAFCDSTGGYLPLLCTMNCTAATEMMRGLFGVSLLEFEALLAGSEPGAGGITAMPFFDGERTPNCPQGAACFFGLTTANSNRQNLLRAVVEATALGLRTGLSALRRQGLVAHEARVIGGGARSEQWRQILADALGLRVVVPEQSESAAFGAALQALWCYKYAHGERLSLAAAVGAHLSLVQSQCAQPQATAVYDEIFLRYHRHLNVVQQLYA